MIGPVKNHRYEQVTVPIDELVPQDHFLRTVDALIDFPFISSAGFLKDESEQADKPMVQVYHWIFTST